MIIEIPKILKLNDIATFLMRIEKVFSMQEKMEPNVIIDLTKIKKTSVLGILLIYKLIDYTYHHNCFKRPNLNVNEFIKKEWHRYGFFELIESYVSNKDISENSYKGLRIHVEDKFIIAPQPLLRKDNYSNKVLKDKFLPKIEKYYSHDDKAVSMIFLCLSEVLLNFWEHAVEDTKSILVAEGNKQVIEIACADTGNGIVSTLGKTLHAQNYSKQQILKKSVEKGVTSKSMTNHMGYGLWILDEIIKLTNGKLHIYSQGAFYRNDMGNKQSGECGFWQGAIIYLSLPLRNPKTLSDIEGCNFENDKLQINWI